MKTLQAHDHTLYFPAEEKAFFSELIAAKNYSSIFILVDDNTEEHCLPYFLANYAIDGSYEVISVEAGEENKHIHTCLGIWEALTKLGADRKSLLINLGGGVITDMGGFVAATFKRGIDFINFPTSLLAMVDASIGGKTGVDLGVLKNQVGVIVNPKAVIIDTAFLASLPANEYRSGYAEMLKHGLIQDEEYWKQLADFSSITTETIGSFILHSVGIKQKVVSQDPFENSLRKILNFGHTLGHAIESYFLTNKNKPTLLHGEAIAIGMVLEAFLSFKLLDMPSSELEEIKRVFASIYSRVDVDKNDTEAIIDLLIYDKKNSHGIIKFALLEAIGVPKWDVEIPQPLIYEAFDFYTS